MRERMNAGGVMRKAQDHLSSLARLGDAKRLKSFNSAKKRLKKGWRKRDTNYFYKDLELQS